MSFNKITYELSILERPSYYQDTLRIVRVVRDHGITLSLKEAEDIWIKYSLDRCSGYLCLPEDDSELWDILIEHEAGFEDPQVDFSRS